MLATSMFLSSLFLMFVFNVGYIMANPSAVNNMLLGSITGTLSVVVSVGVISGIQILGSGLNSMSIKIIFGITALLNMLFQVDVLGFPIGLGLVNNLINVFNPTDMLGLGFFFASGLAIMSVVSGIIIVLGGGS